ncbi:hypothetical protein [Clostridium sp.]|uniref:hypothetical protein n=1 Tax=Clostridium sp. TaxID=1506 RepID=UPI0026053BD0|nr:hypothetical protein [Clostridium sp.]
MKKFIVLLILISLLFNVITISSASSATTFKEGIYQLSNFNISQGNNYVIQNISTNDSVFMIIFDENQHELQSIHLSPKSLKYNLIPLMPNYRIVIVGNGEVTIT